MKCLVTGAAGFIGSHLCERLIAEGHQVFGIDDLSNGKLANLDAIKSHPNFHFRCEKISGLYTTPCEWVFHLAAKADIVPSIEQPEEYHHANVTNTINLLQVARRSNVKRFIYAASSSCYGIPDVYPTPEEWEMSPQYPYALTKYLGEQYVLHWAKVYGLPALSLRLFNVYGPRHRTSGAYGAMFGVFLSQLANGAPVTIVGDGEQTRDFTFVTDVVDAFLKAAQSGVSGRAFNIGSGESTAVNSVAKYLGAKDIVYIPKRPGEPEKTFAAIGAATLKLHWWPRVSIQEGCRAMRELIPQYKDAPLWTPKTIEKATKAWFEHLGG